MSNVTNIPTGESTVVIRLSTPADGEIRAAYSVEEQRAIADPFLPTAGLVELLRARTELLLDDARERRGVSRRLRVAPARP